MVWKSFLDVYSRNIKFNYLILYIEIEYMCVVCITNITSRNFFVYNKPSLKSTL